VIIEEEIQAVAKECLIIHYELSVFTEGDEPRKLDIQKKMINNTNKISELFSKVEPLYKGCLALSERP